MPQGLTDDKSTLVQVLAWRCQATSHCLHQCWPRSPTPYGVTKPHWVNKKICVRYVMKILLLYPRTTKLLGGYTGFTPSVRPSVRLSVRPSRIPCPLCSTCSFGWIHFIFTHLIKQLQKVCRVWSFLQNFKICIFGNFFKFVTLTLSCFTWDLMWITNMGNHGAAGVSQNEGVLVVSKLSMDTRSSAMNKLDWISVSHLINSLTPSGCAVIWKLWFSNSLYKIVDWAVTLSDSSQPNATGPH